VYATARPAMTERRALKRNLELKIATILRISLNRFRDGGAPILQTQSINHHNLNTGIKFITLLEITMLRVFQRSYKILAALNIPEDVTPWAIIKR
jgi:hypothetical protein